MSKNLSMGVDIGAISTKGVILDEQCAILAKSYLWTEGDPVGAVRRMVKELLAEPAESAANGAAGKIGTIGTTGSARRMVGAMLSASAIKNEITAHAVGTLSKYPDTKTILEIGGQDSKIIIIRNKIVTDYAMNTLCAAGTGAFLSAQAKRLGLDVESLGEIALKAANPARLSARCTVFAESDLIHKAQAGYSKADLVAGLCNAVVQNYLNNVGKNKQIAAPIIFQGGVSRNQGVTAAFVKELGTEITVDPDGHLMGAIGAAILARKAVLPGASALGQAPGESSGKETAPFSADMLDAKFETRAYSCDKCGNNCEVVQFFRDGEILDRWGQRCG